MKKKIVTGIVILAVISLLAIPKLNLSGKGDPEARGAARGPQKIVAEGIIVKPSHLDNKLVVTGTVNANESLELRSETSGKITNIYFQEGKHVKKGEVLLQINDDEIRAQLQKERYNKKLNEDNEFRQRRLLEKEAISQEEYENALNRVNTTNADIQVLEAQLDKTKILAPFDGIVGLRYVSQGAYISPSSNIATLYNISPAKIEFSVPGRYSAKVQPGKKIYFTIENHDEQFEGKVYAVEPQIDANTRTLKLRALAENTSGLLIPGQFVKVELILESIDDALLVPTEAVVPDLDGQKVFIAEKNKAKEVKVNVGIRTDRSIEVLSGLTSGDTLITTGLLLIKPGSPLDLQIK